MLDKTLITKLVKQKAFLRSASHSVLKRDHAFRESACGSKTTPDWLKRGPSVLWCAMIGPLTNERTTETFMRQVMHKRVMNYYFFSPHLENT